MLLVVQRLMSPLTVMTRVSLCLLVLLAMTHVTYHMTHAIIILIVN